VHFFRCARQTRNEKDNNIILLKLNIIFIIVSRKPRTACANYHYYRDGRRFVLTVDFRRVYCSVPMSAGLSRKVYERKVDFKFCSWQTRPLRHYKL
jgi:hypothetical protein